MLLHTIQDNPSRVGWEQRGVRSREARRGDGNLDADGRSWRHLDASLAEGDGCSGGRDDWRERRWEHVASLHAGVNFTN